MYKYTSPLFPVIHRYYSFFYSQLIKRFPAWKFLLKFILEFFNQYKKNYMQKTAA